MRTTIAVLLLALTATVARAETDVVEATLNGLKITIGKQTGSIVGLEFPGPGKILQAAPERSGLVDVAYPIPEFEPLRLAARYSSGARIEKSDDAVVISWEGLGPSRAAFKPAGNVAAKVWIEALPDGRSISMRCEVSNHADHPVPQVLFPDLHGLLPVGGKEGTYLRSPGFVRRPFIDMGMTEYPEFYALDQRTRPIDTRDTYVFTGGQNVGDADRMIGRWMDYGGLNGGISLFPTLWAGDPATNVRIFRLEKDPNVRMAHTHSATIAKGETWKSPEYILTPHRHGWAKGIETYRQFVKGKVHRMFPVPDHVRKGLGFRTIIMSLRQPNDLERDAAFQITDLPALAQECRESGLDEMVIWQWRRGFQLPGPGPFPNLGTPEELTDAIKECNKLGVNVSLFISIFSLSEKTAARYDLKVGKAGWTYHPELIPRFNPPYAHGQASVWADPADPRWREDVLVDVKAIYEKYTRSITWDQAHNGTEAVFRQFLPWAKAHDPRATFAGEITQSGERLADWLDYTWNWELGSYHHNLMAPYRDVRGFTAAFPAPRLNYNINRNAQHIKYAFMDNSYVNVMPSAPDSANATAWLKDYPQLGVVLKQCASLRNQFLPYFTDGTLIGECLLSKPTDGAHVSAYVLPDKALLMVMNTRDDARAIDFKLDLEPWLKSASGKYRVRSFDDAGKRPGSDVTTGHDWSGVTPSLKQFDIALFEFIPKPSNP